jgi:alkylhydroperoxidase family enzyme
MNHSIDCAHQVSQMQFPFSCKRIRRIAGRWSSWLVLSAAIPCMVMANEPPQRDGGSADPPETSQADANGDATAEPKPIPTTRSEIKLALERLKQRSPRLPLIAAPEETSPPAASSGSPPRSTANNGAMRRAYLPSDWYRGDFANDPAMTLSHALKTQAFWVVSRGNNCHYCLGHQEHKLSKLGLSDDQIGWLDCDWSLLPKDVALAVSIARKMTLQPHQIVDADLQALQGAMSDPQVIELTHTIAMFNSVNRWTDSLGIPQDQTFRDGPIDFGNPTNDAVNQPTGLATQRTFERPPLESSDEVQLRWNDAMKRQPRVSVAYDPSDPRPRWQQALAIFPELLEKQVAASNAIATGGDLPAELVARLAWVTARHNRAWYALDIARQRLARFNISLESAFRSEAGEGCSEPDACAIRFAEKLTVLPQRITDQDIEALRGQFTDRQVAQIVYVICNANGFDRFTETIAFPLEPDPRGQR